MDLNEYQQLADRTSGARGRQFDVVKGSLGERRLLIACLGLAGEVGEFVDGVKKVVGHRHDYHGDVMVKELGDVLWYLAEAASALGIDLEYIATENVGKLRRRYPTIFSPEQSKARVDVEVSATDTSVEDFRAE